MGYAAIIWVYEDVIRDAERSKDEYNRLKGELGEARLQVCAGGPEGVRSAPVLSHGNCVNFYDRVHSTDTKLYLWAGNRLRPIHELHDKDFAMMKALISDEETRRGILSRRVSD